MLLSRVTDEACVSYVRLQQYYVYKKIPEFRLIKEKDKTSFDRVMIMGESFKIAQDDFFALQ